jgi:hypothetical protein
MTRIRHHPPGAATAATPGQVDPEEALQAIGFGRAQ